MNQLNPNKASRGKVDDSAEIRKAPPDEADTVSSEHAPSSVTLGWKELKRAWNNFHIESD